MALALVLDEFPLPDDVTVALTFPEADPVEVPDEKTEGGLSDGLWPAASTELAPRTRKRGRERNFMGVWTAKWIAAVRVVTELGSAAVAVPPLYSRCGVKFQQRSKSTKAVSCIQKGT